MTLQSDWADLDDGDFDRQTDDYGSPSGKNPDIQREDTSSHAAQSDCVQGARIYQHLPQQWPWRQSRNETLVA